MKKLLSLLLLVPALCWGQSYPNPTFLAPSGGVARTMQSHFSDVINLADYGADPTGVTDATAVLNTVVTTAASTGKSVQICGRYLVNTANFVIPPGVTVFGCPAFYPGNTQSNRNYGSTNATIVLNSAYTIQLGTNARLSNLYVQRYGMGYPTSFRTLVSTVTSMAGTGVTLGDGSTTDSGSDSVIEDVSILGFATGILANQQSRFKINRVGIDATNCINVNNMFDVSWISNVECYPFTTYNTSWANATWPVVGFTTSSNVVTLVLGTPTVSSATLVTGDTVNVYGLANLSGLTTHYSGISVSGSNVTLTGSLYSPVTTANTVSGSTLVTVTGSMTGIGVGQTVSGTGVTGSQTVASVNYRANLVTLSAAANSSQTGTTLTFTSPAYSGAGSVRFEEVRRTGDGLTVANASGLNVTNMFVLGHDIGFHATTGAQGTVFTGCRTDYDTVPSDPTSASYVEDSTNVFSIVNGGSLGSENIAAVLNRTNGTLQAPTTFNGSFMTGYTTGYMIWAGSGRASVVGSPNTGSNGKIYVADNQASLVLSGLDLQGTPTIEYQSAGDAAHVYMAAAQITNGLTFDGGTGSGPRIHGIGSNGESAYLSLPGPSGSWYVGNDTNGSNMSVQDPGGASSNIALVVGGTGSVSSGTTQGNAVKFTSNNGGAVFSGTGTFPTYVGQTAAQVYIESTPVVTGNTFTTSGCSANSLVGGPTVGKYTSGTTGTCTVTVTIPTGTTTAAPNGLSCWAHDKTTPADVQNITASTTTSVTISGTTVSGDIIEFGCIGY